MSDRMLLDYIAEEYDRQALTTEDGFITYKIVGAELVIGDVFVEKSRRGLGSGQKLGIMCEDLARENGCSYLSCNVYVDSERPKFTTDKVRKFLLFGFHILRVHGNNIIMVKELKNAV